MNNDMPDKPQQTDWWIYCGLSDDELAAQGIGIAGDEPEIRGEVRQALHPEGAPPWRRFDRASKEQERGANFIVDDDVRHRVNAALMLRRPLLITGPPGTGKTSLTYAVARELGLGPVLRWSITSRTELRDGLYSYDAVARLQDTQRHFGESVGASGRWAKRSARAPRLGFRTRAPSIEDYLKLGPLGSAFAGFQDEARKDYPRVLLIDEIDKSDIDLPNDLLHIFEEGVFDIDELKRDAASSHSIRTAVGERVTVHDGRVECRAFPIVVMTSNSEREFPAPFLRRCIQLVLQRPDVARLTDIVHRKLEGLDPKAFARHRDSIEEIINAFDRASEERDLAVDQLLQVVLLRMKDIDPFEGVEPLQLEQHRPLMRALWKSLRDDQG